MSHHRYHTSPTPDEQRKPSMKRDRKKELLSQLPTDWQGQAYQLEAYVWDREVQGPDVGSPSFGGTA